MRALGGEGRVTFEGEHYRLKLANPGPAPRHAIELWIGAYKPRMLALTGRKGDGWLPSLSYLQPGDLAKGNAAIDAAARAAGRDPAAIRRMLNLPLPADPVAEFTRLAREERVETFIVSTDDPARDRGAGADRRGRAGRRIRRPANGLGITPTPELRRGFRAPMPWDESTRPHHEPPPCASYTEHGRAVGQHLVDVHDMLRGELGELRDLVAHVRAGVLTAGTARWS